MDDNKLREIFASIADVEPLSDGWPVLSKFANAVLAAADAEAVPVAWSFEIATAMLDGQYVNFEKRLTDYAPNTPPGSVRNVRPLYARPQPAPDVGVLVEALRDILMHVGKGREDGVEWVCEPIHSDEIKAARKALAEWEAKR